MQHWGMMIVYALINVILVLLIAPFLEGVLRKVTARIQSRQGPPLWQPYFDILKLLGKEDVESGEAPVMQRFAAYLCLASALTVVTLLPIGMPSPMNQAADVLWLIYLLTLSGISMLLAGLASGSTYSLVGMSREMMSMMILEPLFAIALIIGAVHAHSLRIDSVLNGSIYESLNFPWSGLMMLGVLIFSFQAFLCRVPFDTTEAETEIMEGSLIEYSGPKLALFKYVRMAKLFIYSTLFMGIFIPWGHVGFYPADLLILLGKIFLLVLLVTVIAATHARYRIDQALRYYAMMFFISIIALGLAAYGY